MPLAMGSKGRTRYTHSGDIEITDSMEIAAMKVSSINFPEYIFFGMKNSQEINKIRTLTWISYLTVIFTKKKRL